MIRRITIQGFKSFSPHQPTVVALDPTKRAALFYGLNGAGKSAIAQVLARHVNNPAPNCSVEFTHNDAYPILVYNEAFVDRTFRNRTTVPGIFTIGEPAAEALREAERLEADMVAWRDARERLNEEGQARQVDLHRVRKHQYSEVVALQKKDLLNDYEAFWAIVKDAKVGKASGATVANAMRCILERFFYFNRRQLQMKEALSALSAADHRFVPLARYLDRQSHADANTRTDFSDYDVAYYLAKFEAVFQHVDAMHHYRAMLGEGDEEAS